MKDILRISAPFSLWLMSFSALYGLHGLICSESWPATQKSASAALIAAALLAIVLQIACLFVLRAFPASQALPRRMVPVLALAALVATVWTTLPIIATSACI